MDQSLAFACECGDVSGSIQLAQPVDGECMTCHCHDCRDFVRLCGKAETMLDDLGGVHLFNFRGSALTITSGRELIRCLHMTEKPVLRWHSSCCNTPLFNSFATTTIPFFDIFREVLADEEPLAALAKTERHLFVESATGDASALRASSALSLMLRTVPRMLREYVGGARHRNPLFNAKTGKPFVEPRFVTREERRAIQ